MRTKLIGALIMLLLLCVPWAAAQEAAEGEAEPAEPKKEGEEAEKKAPEPEEIDKIIDRLENKDEEVRDKALAELKALGKDAQTRLIEHGLVKYRHPAVVTRIAVCLGELHTKASAAALKKLLKSNISEIVVAGMRAVEKHGDEQLVHHVLPLITAEDEMVRRTATLILGKFGYISSVGGLTKLLKSAYPHVQIDALEHLRKYPKVKDMIVDDVAAVLKDPNPEVALEAAATLQSLKDSRGEEFFRTMLGKKDPAFKTKVVQYAGRYRVKSAVPFLIKQLKDRDWLTRYNAVDALGKIGDPLALPSLKVLFERERVLAVRRALAATFYEYAHPNSMDFLKPKVQTERDTDIRWFVVATVGRIGGDDAIFPLINALMDSDEKIRLAAAIGLRSITGKSFEFNHKADSEDRVKAVRSWEYWYKQQKKGR